jgi:iron(III) transport system permease protein
MTDRRSDLAFRLVTMLGIVWVVLLPVAGFFLSAGGTEGPGPGMGPVLRTLAVGGMAAGVAFLLGVPVALVLARVRLPGRGLLLLVSLIPLGVSPTIQAYAWLIFPGSDSWVTRGVLFLLGATPGGVAVGVPAWACGMVLGLALWPIVAFLGAAGLSGGVGPLEEAAAPYATPGRILRRITLPGLWPGALSGAAVVFWMAAASFTVPSLMVVNTLSTEVFARVASGGGRPAMVGSLLTMAVALVPIAVLGVALRRRPATSLGVPSDGMEIRRGRAGLLLVTLVAVGLGAGYPVAALVMQTDGGLGDPAQWRRVLTLGAGPLARSALVAALGAALAAALGLVAASAFPRGGWGRRAAWAAGFLSFVLPGYLLGQGLTFIYNRPGPLRLIYEGWPVLVLGLGGAFFLPAFAALSVAHAGVPPSMQEAAAVSGAGSLRRLLRITVPLLRRDILAVWLVLFAILLGEAGSAVLREPPGFQMVQVLIFNQMHYGRDKDVATLSLLVVAIAVVPLCWAVRIGSRGRRMASR